jgi:hypothetical protein
VRDVNFDFEVGVEEPHRVDVHWREKTSKLIAEVDGRRVFKKGVGIFAKELRQFRFSVGSAERHEILIEMHSPSISAQIKKAKYAWVNTFTVFVDGVEFGTFSSED